jgi:hypothetical protein
MIASAETITGQQSNDIGRSTPGGSLQFAGDQKAGPRIEPKIIKLYIFQVFPCLTRHLEMGVRGRPSLEALMVRHHPTEIVQRPEAPYDLTGEQSEEWRAIINFMPPDHFMRGNYPLLAQLCRHIVSARRVAQLIDETAKQTDLNRKEFGALLRLQATESSMITHLLRAMRLTQQSVMRAETTKHPKGLGKAPWDPE